MKEVFSWQRFGLLWRSFWIERWQEVAGLLCVGGLLNIIAGIFFLAMDAKTYEIFQYDGQAGWFTFTWFLTGSIFTGLYARSFANDKASLIYLHTPASHTEKTLLAFIVVAIVFPLIFFIALTLLNLPFIKLAQSLYEPCTSCESERHQFRPFIPFISTLATPSLPSLDHTLIKFQLLFLSSYWCIQAFILGGYIYFRRFPVLAIITCGCLIFFTALALKALPWSNPYWLNDKESLTYFTAEAIILSQLEWLLLPIILWICVFFHIKERQL